MPQESVAARAANSEGWTIPQNYQPVHDCFMALRIRPYQDIGKVTLGAVLRQYWYWIGLAFVGLVILVAAVIYFQRLNVGLRQTRVRLQPVKRSQPVP